MFVTLLDFLNNHRPGDGRAKVGLVLQGGGMRAAYSAGAIKPLIHHGLAHSFDHVIGSSAGAINGTYLLSGDLETNQSYVNDLTNKKFIDFKRKQKKVDIDYLVDVVMKQHRPLNLHHIAENPAELHIIATHIPSGESVNIADKPDTMYEKLRATAALPYLYGNEVVVDGEKYIDGGVSNLIPVDVALANGCTHIIVVLTKRLREYSKNNYRDSLLRRINRYMISAQNDALTKLIPEFESRLKHNVELLQNPPNDIRLHIMQPTASKELAHITSSKKHHVAKSAQAGIADMETLLQSTV